MEGLACVTVAGTVRYIDTAAFAAHRADLDLLAHQHREAGSAPPQTPAGTTILGRGLCSVVYGLGAHALKVYVPNATGLAVAPLMRREIDTYRRLATSAPRGMPRHLDDQTEEATPTYCGWLLMTSAPGRTLSPEEVSALPPDALTTWTRGLVAAAIEVEDALERAVPAPEWRDDYASVRLIRIRQLAREGIVPAGDLAIAERLAGLIAQRTKARRLLHGDLNPPNILTDMQGAPGAGVVISLVDPLINFDAPEANWRHFTAVAPLAIDLAEEYARQRNVLPAIDLLFAIGALTHLFMSIVLRGTDTREAERRKHCLRTCLALLEP